METSGGLTAMRLQRRGSLSNTASVTDGADGETGVPIAHVRVIMIEYGFGFFLFFVDSRCPSVYGVIGSCPVKLRRAMEMRYES